jgi:hypothetical protein
LPYSINGIDSSDRETIIGRIHQEEHRDRAIACVNGCQGIANPAAVRDAVDAAERLCKFDKTTPTKEQLASLGEQDAWNEWQADYVRHMASLRCALRRLRETETEAKKGGS